MRRSGGHLEPWERKRGESGKAFEAFCAYRDMGPSRNQAAVGRQLSKARSLVSRWASKWDWTERCRAWDSEEALRKAKEALKEREETDRRHLALARALQGKLAQRLQSLDASEMSVGDLIRGLSEGLKLERLVLGLDTERVAGGGVTVNTQVQVGSVIPREVHKEMLADSEIMRGVHKLLTMRSKAMADDERSPGLPPKLEEGGETSLNLGQPE
jgi:hypothetical protein